jgi:hypothetical protein
LDPRGPPRAERSGSRYLIREDDLAAVADEPRSVGVPDEWRTFPSGRPAPDWVRIIVVTVDSRLRLGADRLGVVVLPTEL